MRVGLGFDLHKLNAAPAGSSIPLGGVAVPAEFTVEAHSDGDVLLHAMVDAVLGALALGDIGRWFPDTDPKWKGVTSDRFALAAVEAAAERGWKVAQIDANILAERPKIAPVVESIRAKLAELFRCPLDGVSVKAKTMEGLGPIGERKAIAAQVIVMLERN